MARDPKITFSGGSLRRRLNQLSESVVSPGAARGSRGRLSRLPNSLASSLASLRAGGAEDSQATAALEEQLKAGTPKTADEAKQQQAKAKSPEDLAKEQELQKAKSGLADINSLLKRRTEVQAILDSKNTTQEQKDKAQTELTEIEQRLDASGEEVSDLIGQQVDFTQGSGDHQASLTATSNIADDQIKRQLSESKNADATILKSATGPDNPINSITEANQTAVKLAGIDIPQQPGQARAAHNLVNVKKLLTLTDPKSAPPDPGQLLQQLRNRGRR